MNNFSKISSLKMEKVSYETDDLSQELSQFINRNSEILTSLQSEVVSGSATSVGGAVTSDGVVPMGAITGIKKRTWNPLTVRTTQKLNSIANYSSQIYFKMLKKYSIKEKKKTSYYKDYELKLLPFVKNSPLLLILVGMFLSFIMSFVFSFITFAITNEGAVFHMLWGLPLITIFIIFYEHNRIQKEIPRIEQEFVNILTRFEKEKNY